MVKKNPPKAPAKPKKKIKLIKPKEPVKPKKKIKLIKPKAPAKKEMVELPDKTRNFDYWYYGNLNEFLNDVIDSKKKTNGRKVGFRSVSSRWKKLIKKKKGATTEKDVMDFYNKEYPDGEYYLE